ncbi:MULTISPECIES: hypothetical protein [Nonomuraea]|uniref:DUF1579 domain-containing protein n=1 Tax=Nonomuraea ferruginea TaxID=46174 RepID=A0ABT4T515_9ACTN|nr:MULTISPECIES: hypothetical protein [Nonomuraea]MDA0644601.1 hypothetical protein [Nonomuraea ferruginea]TXK39175.1 hypothetical protein FR742_05905 [Nonomuraea sp. C10]
MNDFDFLAGTWNVANRRLVKRLAGSDDWEEFPGVSTSTRHFGGAANFDEIHFPTLGYSGLTLRLYEPATRLWSIYWSSSRTGTLDLPPMVGGFDGDRGRFYADELHEGTPVRSRFLWTVLGPDACRWEQALSADGERTWETNWTMDFTRA